MYNARESFALTDFSFGWDISQTPLDLDPRALADCRNFNLTTKRGLEKRGGITKLYPTAASGSVRDIYEYKSPSGVNYILIAAGTSIQSYYESAWHELKTGLTAGARLTFVTHQGFCYGANGANANFKLYGTTAYAVGIPVPTAAPGVADGGAGGLTGKYTYVYCYRRSTPGAQTGNPSIVSAELDLTDRKFQVSYVASADPQVDTIVIYRTLDLNDPGTDPTAYFKVAEVANATSAYDDEVADEDLGAALELDNGAPPKSKFIALHRDHVFYAYCPDEEDGGSLVKWSKAGQGEAVPSTNYQYFDRRDGEDITGIAPLKDGVVVFKRNRVFVLRHDLESGAYVPSEVQLYGVGCVAPWAIILFEDKVIFLAEEGWKSFDGENLYDISKSIRPLAQQGYTSINQAENYSAAFYPARDHFIYFCNHSTLAQRMFVGHFLVPLLYINKGIPEQLSQNIVGWTYHDYPNHSLTCIGRFTDPIGITRLVAGASDGYIYQLDSGANGDDGSDIPYSLLTGWHPLGKSPALYKTVRIGFVSTSSDRNCTLDLRVEKDFEPAFFTGHLSLVNPWAAYCGYAYCGFAYCGMPEGFTARAAIPGSPGQLYRFGLSGSDKAELTIQGMTFMFRTEGVR